MTTLHSDLMAAAQLAQNIKEQYATGVYDRTIAKHDTDKPERFVELFFDKRGCIVVLSRNGKFVRESGGAFEVFYVDEDPKRAFSAAARFYIGLVLKMRGEDLALYIDTNLT